jgi:hypothetical protein
MTGRRAGALWTGAGAARAGKRLRSGSRATAIIVRVAVDARHRGRFRFSQGAAAHEPQLDIHLPCAQRPNALATLASLPPARRASRVELLGVLKSE